jgi:glucoamylase
MAWARAGLALGAVVAVALVLVSGGSDADPRTPPGLAGMPPPFLGTAVTGSGGLTAAVDAYGDIVDLRAPGPAGTALIDNSAARQTAGTVAVDTGIVPRVRVGGGPALPLWRADSVSQRYLPGTSVVRTTARFGRVRMAAEAGAGDRRLALVMEVAGAGSEVEPSISVDVEGAACRSSADRGSLALLCMRSEVPRSRRFLEAQPSGIAIFPRRGSDPFIASARAYIARAESSDRAWLAAAEPLGGGAPPWARAMFQRSLLTMRALSSRRTGAVAAGARDGWTYVWPRDAATAALAFAAAGYRGEARSVARYLRQLDLGAAARFDEDGEPIAGRSPQGDAAGWVAAATLATGLPPNLSSLPWRNRPDYQESTPGTYLGNAIAASAAEGLRARFGTRHGLVRRAGDPGSGLDSAAAWAVRPFPLPTLFSRVRRTLAHLVVAQTRFGITPGEGWAGGADPWTAPTAWTAWSFAALADAQHHNPSAARADRRQALRLLGDLRRAATPAGALPERVDVRSGLPRSTTPLGWSHAFAILALRQLWP